MSETGSIIDIQNRLLLWANRPEQGLARVEFASEFSRQQVIRSLREALTAKNLPFDEIVLPTHQDPELVVSTLIDRLADSTGVVSITGFSTAFNNQMSLSEALRIVNFNRERFLVPGVKQIWWMTPAFLQTSIHVMPDLNRWFSLRLQLTEAIRANHSTEIEPDLDFAPASYANMADTHRRVENLLQRFHKAQAAHLPDELLVNYLLPALESLAEVGAQQELRDLTLQFEGLLGRLKVNDSQDVANSLDSLAGLYYRQGRYSDAEPLFVRALTIREQQLGANHPATGTSLNKLANLYRSIGRYSDAEPLYLRALAIKEDYYPLTAHSLYGLANLYRSIGRYSDAEVSYVRALAIRERISGANNLIIADILNNLASLYRSIGRYSDAEPLYVRALAIREQQLGANHPDTAIILNNLASLYRSIGRYGDAEPLYIRALSIKEQQLGANHPDTAISLNNLAELYRSIHRYSNAEPLYIRAISILEQQLGVDHPHTKTGKRNLELLRSR
jgi:tetratricopeptide (TPR) repeat protein